MGAMEQMGLIRPVGPIILVTANDSFGLLGV